MDHSPSILWYLLTSFPSIGMLCLSPLAGFALLDILRCIRDNKPFWLPSQIILVTYFWMLGWAICYIHSTTYSGVWRCLSLNNSKDSQKGLFFLHHFITIYVTQHKGGFSMFTWKQILFILIFSLIITGSSRILRKKLVPKGIDPFLPSFIIAFILMMLQYFIF